MNRAISTDAASPKRQSGGRPLRCDWAWRAAALTLDNDDLFVQIRGESAMVLWSGPLADVSPYVAGAFGLLGSFIGGAITATASFLVGRRASEVAATSWLRDARRDIYARFLREGDELLKAHLASHRSPASQEAAEAIDRAQSNFFELYAGVQLIGTGRVVEAARVFAYLLLELKDGRLGSENFQRLFPSARLAGQDVMNAMRVDYGLDVIARPTQDQYQANIRRPTSTTS